MFRSVPFATPRSRSRLLLALAFAGALLGVVLVLLAAPRPAAAICSPEPCTPDPTPFFSTLTVNRPAVGKVTSSDGTINCTAGASDTCSVTDEVDKICNTTCTRPTSGWPTYVLSASSGPTGYAPNWSTCGRVTTCSVTNSESSTTVSMNWVDVTAPSLTSLSSPVKTGPFLTVSGAATDNSGTVSELDFVVQNASNATVASKQVTGLSGGTTTTAIDLSSSSIPEGAYHVIETARDASGNISGQLTHTVTLDKSVHISGVPLLAAYQNTIPALSFTPDSDVPSSNIVCRVYANGATVFPAYGPCTSPFAPASLADGSWVYDVQVTDDVGNTTNVTRAFTLDTVAPALSESAGPSEGQTIGTASPSITIAQTELHPGTFTCTIDGTLQACSAGSPLTLSNLAEGAHTFVATATDAAGNSATPLTRHFTVDTAVNLALGALPAVSNGAPNLTFSTDGDVPAANRQCRAYLTGTTAPSFGSCTTATSFAPTLSSEGAWTYEVQVTDAVGNVKTLTTGVTIDRTPPALSLDGPAEGGTVATSSIHVTPSETELHPATLECQLDSAAFAPCTSGTQVALAGLANGTHTFTVHAVDAAGNQASLTRTFLVQVPSTPSGGGGSSTPTLGGGSSSPSGGGGSSTTTPSTSPPVINAPLSFTIKRGATWTVFRSIVLRQVPSGATIRVSCAGAGCPAPKHWTLHRAGTVTISNVAGHRLGVGAKLTITVTKAGMQARTFVLTVRRGKAPVKTVH